MVKTKYKGNLELNWINKDKSLYYEYDKDGNPGKPIWVEKNDIKVSEPRILKLVKEYGDVSGLKDPLDNALIRGDNLLALRTLVEMFKEREEKDKVKCVYIDPPYNTGAAFENYDDNLQRSEWLTMMRDRLNLLKKLLRNDGYIFVQIDDNEYAYLKVLMDEVFGPENFVNSIAVKMSEPTGVKMAHVEKRLPKLKEHILFYKKLETPSIDVDYIDKLEWDSEYNQFILGVNKDEINNLKIIMENEERSEEDIKKADKILSKFKLIKIESIINQKNLKKEDQILQFKRDNAWRIIRTCATSGGAKKAAFEKMKKTKEQVFCVVTSKKKMYVMKRIDVSKAGKDPRIKLLFAEDYLKTNPGDFWSDIKTTGIENEGGVYFPKSKKPERLIWRIVNLATNESDLVLDSFLGSGTTAAVAHKMKRRWIGIEIGKHAETHCIKRLKLSIEETKENTQTKLVKEIPFRNGFRYFKLGESLLSDNKMNWNLTYEELSQALFMNFDYLFKEKINNNTFFGKSGKNIAICIVAKEMKIIKKAEIQKILNKIKNNKTTKITIFTNHGIAITNEDLPDNITIKKIPESILGKYKL